LINNHNQDLLQKKNASTELGEIPAEKKMVICVFQFSVKPEVFKTTEILSKASGMS
jgi:hypothetical protein